MRAKPHLEHLLFCPPCLIIADGVLESPLNVLDYHFWLVDQVVHNQPIHFVRDKGGSQIVVRFLDTFQITSMLCNNRTLPMGLSSSSECMHSPWAVIPHTLHLICTAATLHDSKFLPQRYRPQLHSLLNGINCWIFGSLHYLVLFVLPPWTPAILYNRVAKTLHPPLSWYLFTLLV